MKPGATYIDVSTIDPATARKLSDAAEAKGIHFLECPLGKTPAHAEKAEEPIFAGGKKAVYEKMLETLQIIGKPVYYLGDVEAACALKLISNLIGMTNLAVLTEGIRIGEKAGIEPKYLLELLNDTGAKSFQMDVRGPWIAGGDFKSRFGLDLALKDVRLGCEMAKSLGQRRQNDAGGPGLLESRQQRRIWQRGLQRHIQESSSNLRQRNPRESLLQDSSGTMPTPVA